MTITGGCYCGEIRYESKGEPQAMLQCHCRECQYISGGNANLITVLPADGFSFTKGEPKSFTRTDIERPVTRLFCPTCGTSIATKTPNRPDSVIVKVGTLDDPTTFKLQMAIFAKDKQPFHFIPDGLPTFDKRPG